MYVRKNFMPSQLKNTWWTEKMITAAACSVPSASKDCRVWNFLIEAAGAASVKKGTKEELNVSTLWPQLVLRLPAERNTIHASRTRPCCTSSLPAAQPNRLEIQLLRLWNLHSTIFRHRLYLSHFQALLVKVNFKKITLSLTWLRVECYWSIASKDTELLVV